MWRETVHGQSGGSGTPVRGRAEWVSSRGSGPSSAPGSTAHGAKTSWEETWSIASVTSGRAEVSSKFISKDLEPYSEPHL